MLDKGGGSNDHNVVRITSEDRMLVCGLDRAAAPLHCLPEHHQHSPGRWQSAGWLPLTASAGPAAGDSFSTAFFTGKLNYLLFDVVGQKVPVLKNRAGHATMFSLRNNVKRLSRQATTRQTLASGSRENVSTTMRWRQLYFSDNNSRQ